jgi:hypothetical protein
MSIVAQPAMQEQIIPLRLMCESMLERKRLAESLGADASQDDVGQFAQADADVNALLESWAARLATTGDQWLAQKGALCYNESDQDGEEQHDGTER